MTLAKAAEEKVVFMLKGNRNQLSIVTNPGSPEIGY